MRQLAVLLAGAIIVCLPVLGCEEDSRGGINPSTLNQPQTNGREIKGPGDLFKPEKKTGFAEHASAAQGSSPKGQAAPSLSDLSNGSAPSGTPGFASGVTPNVGG